MFDDGYYWFILLLLSELNRLYVNEQFLRLWCAYVL